MQKHEFIAFNCIQIMICVFFDLIFGVSSYSYVFVVFICIRVFFHVYLFVYILLAWNLESSSSHSSTACVSCFIFRLFSIEYDCREFWNEVDFVKYSFLLSFHQYSCISSFFLSLHSSFLSIECLYCMANCVWVCVC